MTSAASSPLELVDAPSTTAEVSAFLPRLSTALEGEAPLLALPRSGPERERLQELAQGVAVARDIALVVPTSGSTGHPRLALLSAAALRASADSTHTALGGPGRWLLALPTTHIAGLQVLIRSLRSGLEPVVVSDSDGFTATSFVDAVGSLDVASSEPPHYTALVPTQLQRLLNDGAAVEALWQLDAVLVGGAAASTELLARASASGVTVVTTYGMTETCGGCVYDGVPLPGVDIAIADDRRISIAGPVLFDGYLNAQHSPVINGWFSTADLGRIVDAVLHVDSRADNVITSGGVKVPAEAVEQVVLDMPGINAVVVVGVPDAEWGEHVVAVVAADVAIALDAVRAVCLDKLPREWLPRDVLTLESLPMLPSGKPDRAAIQHIAGQLAR
ncbi:MAG: o-succinylbenzoate--CoA ligase [Actinomycetia bacterium]|nr:o-succinylbenzoate--CoA ligase [Actinomycetes bacterium]